MTGVQRVLFRSYFGKKFENYFRKKIKHSKNTFTPSLDYAHNLYKSLLFVKKNENKKFKKIKKLLLYPNFISYKLSGKLASDQSYFANHSFLWDFKINDLSNFANSIGIKKILPPFTYKKKIGELLNNNKIDVFSGKHDSSCCYFYHKKNFKKNFILLSTGTWIIIYNKDGKLNSLKVNKDTHFGLSIERETIAVARYPGGHEFNYLNKNIKKYSKINLHVIKKIIKNKDLVKPSFYRGGAFQKQKGKIILKNRINRNNKEYMYHLNMLYISSIVFYTIKILGKITKPIIVDGIFARNKFFVSMLSCLIKSEKVFTSKDENGVAKGGFLIMNNLFKFNDSYNEIQKHIELQKLMAKYYRSWEKNLKFN